MEAENEKQAIHVFMKRLYKKQDRKWLSYFEILHQIRK